MTVGKGRTPAPFHSAIATDQMASVNFLIEHGGAELLLARNNTIRPGSGCQTASIWRCVSSNLKALDSCAREEERTS
jgi:hypothetical protein